MLDKSILISLMNQAPTRFNWFKGRDLPIAPKEPSKELISFSPLGDDIGDLITKWLSDEGEYFDLWDVDFRMYDFLRVSDITIEQMIIALKEFQSTWEKYWDARDLYKKHLELILDIQWRIYWAKEALKEIEKETNVLD